MTLADDLDTRIDRAESAVVERDRRLLARGREVIRRVERGARHGVVRGLWGGAAALALAWLAPRRRRPLPSAHAAPPASALAVSVPALIPLLWPLLPPAWRRRMNPASAAMLAAIGVPLLQGLLPKRPAPQTVPAVDLSRFAGRWFEIAHLPAAFESGCTQARIHYTPHADHLHIDKHCHLPDGRQRRSHAVAYVVEGSGGARFEVSSLPRGLRWLPGTWARQWVLDADADYQHALVGTPRRNGLWLLARSPRIDDAAYQRLVGIAAAQGYRVDRLRRIGDG